ncbi:Amino acid/polyamine transporter I [Macleaya cordata]|uniref:Amino acid/polyamine transporter I n=1 Tax=Macleaya cordata TaxID=56857 RepID=A0A200RCI7_MACCD|nr:Amino acid/polyamine transporter I [Macleaya cordata]
MAQEIQLQVLAEGEPTTTSTTMTTSTSPPSQSLNKSPYRLLEDPLGQQTQHEPKDPNTKNQAKKLTLIPLIFLIYFEVSGGPFGEEPSVKAAGPLFAILGFLLFPFIWSIPEALITAELATTFPGNGGYVIWADRAFGPFWGSLLGSWKFFSGVINNAAYPVLCADYMKLVFPIFASGLPRDLAITFSTLVLSFLNYTGLTIVGYTAVALGTISLCPFILMGLISIPKIHPSRWISLGQKGMKKDWNLYFNTLFWNLNFWDNASTLAGEVDKPQKTFPKALFSAGIITCFAYLIPLLATTGSLTVDQSKWEDGFLADAAGMIAGNWLKFWVSLGSVLSAIGLFEAQLSSSSFQLEGMANLGFVPRFFSLRSSWFNTPWVGILICSSITLGVSFMDFTNIISSANFLYSLGMLLEFSSFIRLRVKYPSLKRPYKVPMGIPGLVIMCLIPSGFLIFVMVIASKIVFLVSGILTLFGILGYFFMQFCKSRELFFKFSIKKDDEEEKEEGHERN